MKGVILAGGTGSRLYPCTKVTNKHLLPVYNKPMIYYPIETLKRSGIQDILIVSSPEHAGDFMQLLGSGAEFNVNFTYRIQDGAGGIAQALSLAEDFSAGEPIAAILSDNIFEDDFSDTMFRFKSGAEIFVKEVEDPQRFGVVEMREDGSVRSVEEKPSVPKSPYAQTGLFVYDAQVFDFIRKIEPSKRGELEITDVNNLYLDRNQLKAKKIIGMWADAGTHESLLEANLLAASAFDPERVKNYRKSKHKSTHAPNQDVSPKVTVGILAHNSEKYISDCLNSLLAQEYENLEIVVLDNNSNDQTLNILRGKFEDVRIIESEVNLGFAKGHNQILAQTDSQFYACLNVDMIFEPSFISHLIKTIDEKPTYGSAGGKLKRWDFEGHLKRSGQIREMGKTNFIDSAGLKILKNHRFEDIGQGEVDHGQFDQVTNLFGISGAAALYRRKALEDIAFVNKDGRKEYFDEAMFMYKEDIDLAYRLQWAGWKCRYTPYAVGYHDRSVTAGKRSTWDLMKNRANKPSKVNQISYRNHQILLQKNYSGAFSSETKGATSWYNFKIFMYLVLFEQETLIEWFNLLRLRKNIKARRQAMPRRVSQADIEALMEG